MLDAVNDDKRLRTLLISAIKRVWHRHPNRLEILKRVRLERQDLTKEGKPRKRKSVFYICEECAGLAKPQKTSTYPQIHIDHIDPVIPIHGYADLTWDEYLLRLFCKVENLQALCTVCHDKKTADERVLRVAHRKGVMNE